jgi:hypothetical protein
VVAGSGIAPFHGGVYCAYGVPSMESRVCRGGATGPDEIATGEGELAAMSSVVQERVGRRRESLERTCLGDDDVGVTEGDGAGAVLVDAGDPEVAGLLGVVAGDEDADLGGPRSWIMDGFTTLNTRSHRRELSPWSWVCRGEAAAAALAVVDPWAGAEGAREGVAAARMRDPWGMRDPLH